jgi:hypothetical protein
MFFSSLTKFLHQKYPIFNFLSFQFKKKIQISPIAKGKKEVNLNRVEKLKHSSLFHAFHCFYIYKNQDNNFLKNKCVETFYYIS